MLIPFLSAVVFTFALGWVFGSVATTSIDLVEDEADPQFVLPSVAMTIADTIDEILVEDDGNGAIAPDAEVASVFCFFSPYVGTMSWGVRLKGCSPDAAETVRYVQRRASELGLGTLDVRTEW